MSLQSDNNAQESRPAQDVNWSRMPQLRPTKSHSAPQAGLGHSARRVELPPAGLEKPRPCGAFARGSGRDPKHYAKQAPCFESHRRAPQLQSFLLESPATPRGHPSAPRRQPSVRSGPEKQFCKSRLACKASCARPCGDPGVANGQGHTYPRHQCGCRQVRPPRTRHQRPLGRRTVLHPHQSSRLSSVISAGKASITTTGTRNVPVWCRATPMHARAPRRSVRRALGRPLRTLQHATAARLRRDYRGKHQPIPVLSTTPCSSTSQLRRIQRCHADFRRERIARISPSECRRFTGRPPSRKGCVKSRFEHPAPCTAAKTASKTLSAVVVSEVAARFDVAPD